MNYLRLAIAILATVTAQCSYADSIPVFHITQVTMSMGPNDGSGDNVAFGFTGPKLNITGIGGMACFDWCFLPIPDPSIAQPSQIFLTFFDTAIIGGITHDPSTLAFNSLFDAFGGLNASTAGSVGAGDSFIQFRITAPTNGSWSFNFAPTTDENGNPAFFFTDGAFSASAPVPTPEPAAIGLMLTGLAGIAGIAKRKARFRH
jgi:hypothetical protein